MDPYIYQAWPSWFYGPNGEAAIFEEHDDIPEGWTGDPKAFNKETTNEEDAPEASAEAADEAEEGEVLAELPLSPEAEALVAPKRRGRPPRAAPTETDF